MEQLILPINVSDFTAGMYFVRVMNEDRVWDSTVCEKIESMKTFGIIGGGMIARFHAKAIQQMKGGQLGAIYARNPAKSDCFRKRI